MIRDAIAMQLLSQHSFSVHTFSYVVIAQISDIQQQAIHFQETTHSRGWKKELPSVRVFAARDDEFSFFFFFTIYPGLIIFPAAKPDGKRG